MRAKWQIRVLELTPIIKQGRRKKWDGISIKFTHRGEEKVRDVPLFVPGVDQLEVGSEYLVRLAPRFRPAAEKWQSDRYMWLWEEIEHVKAN